MSVTVQRSCSSQAGCWLQPAYLSCTVAADRTNAIVEVPTIDQVVGNTPLVCLQRMTGLEPSNKIYVKLEGGNPGGSAKDRTALAMLNAAEASGHLQPGGHVIECTTGNTGIALAAWCAARGYRLTIIMPSNMTEERKVAISAYGANILLTQTLEEGRSLAQHMADAGEGVLLDQNNNPANPAVHEASTGKEIWLQTGGRLTHFIAGMGTSGTLVGCARALKARNPAVSCIGLEPPATEATAIPGIRRWPEEYRPAVRDDSLIDATMAVSRREAEETARALARTEGLLLGISAAGAVSAALRLAAGLRNATIVVLACDRGDRYLSTGVFSSVAGAADPAPCPPEELPSVVARIAAGAYGQGPVYLSFPAVAAAASEATSDNLAAVSASIKQQGSRVVQVVGQPDWSAPGIPTAAALAAAAGNAPVLVRLVLSSSSSSSSSSSDGEVYFQLVLSQQLRGVANHAAME